MAVFGGIDVDWKKTIVFMLVTAFVGFLFGFIVGGRDGGLLGISASILPAISGLGAAHRSNNRMVESVGAGRDQLDEGRGLVEDSIEYLRRTNGNIRSATDSVRKAAKPVGEHWPVDYYWDSTDPLDDSD
jgi:hypothetical protein